MVWNLSELRLKGLRVIWVTGVEGLGVAGFMLVDHARSSLPQALPLDWMLRQTTN